MAQKSTIEKLAVLADAAKYDASCASSGSVRRNSVGSDGVGSTGGMGICHSYAPDGRCISLLKILLTNFCVFDCRYCINRVSSNVERARFTPKEVVDLTLSFYKRNYIEGLFLSSGIIQSSNYTMECLVEVARSLRQDHHFAGYIHLKTIPDADPRLIEVAGRYADRLSINIELPTDEALAELAPDKNAGAIKKSMADLKSHILAAKYDHDARKKSRFRPPPFAPGGQSTQMIIGADQSDDGDILRSSMHLYSSFGLKRVYYSAFSPIAYASNDLPPIQPPLLREHRLYQADWMLRFYGFERDEILLGATNGMLDLAIDPKLAWALRRRDLFPVDINCAPRETLLRVPGLGPKVVDRLIKARRHGRLKLDDVARLTRSVKTMLPFVETADYSPGGLTDSADLRARFAPRAEQLTLAL